MANAGLLFIPDISGFTRFINDTEIDHSRLIIQELLEVMINTNTAGLEISEIEGDAILFYKFGEAPQLGEVYKQVENLFCAFHRQLIAYNYRRFCQCKACNAAINLTLKVVTHYGEFTGYTVRNFQKLLGKDVIVAHQLLKNDIDQHEYWLVTDNLSKDEPPKLAGWMQWNSSAKHTESGEIPFRYTQLTALKMNVQPDPLPLLQLSKKKKVLSFSREYETQIIPLFHATGNFSYRSRWQEGVKAVEEVNHFLPRVGMKCRCFLNNGTSSIYASSYSFTPEHIEFSETDEESDNTIYYTLESVGGSKTKLTVDYYIPNKIFGETVFRLTKKTAFEKTWNQSMENITHFIKEIHLPEEVS